MKILRVTSMGYEAGGSDNGIILLNPILRAMGHDVRTLASDAVPSMPHFNEYEYPSLAAQPGFLKLFYRSWYPASYFALRKVLKEFNPDIVQLHTMFELSPSVLFALRDYPTVLTIHGAEDFTPSLLLWAFPVDFFKDKGFAYSNLTWKGWFHYLYHSYINGMVYKLGFKHVSRFIVFSRYMQNLLQKDGIESVCIPNATTLFAPAPLDLESTNIIFVGRLEKIKGLQDIIVALPEILKRVPSATLAVAGVGTYESELKQLASDMRVSREVLFLGHKTREELYELYKKSALIIMPSIWPEPFGKVGIEAMSVGRPVIACNVGGISEWLSDGKVGYLIPPEHPDVIIEKALAILTNPTLRQEMSINALNQAKEFSIEKHAERIVALYESVIETFHQHRK